jgi:integrase
MTITISSESAKNRTQQSVTIPKALEPILRDLKLETYPADWYLFGRYEKISQQRTKKSDYFSYKFRKIANSLNIDKTKGFYAWKHSGVCALYEATKDPYIVMVQARHSDIKTTMIYLRSLGLTVDERVRRADFSL